MDKRLLGIVTVFFLSFGVFASVLVFNKPLSRLIRASQELNPSATSSLVFAWPLTVPADGATQSTITVFLRNEKNYPVANKPITLTTSLGQIKQAEQVSAKDGKAEFQIISQASGLANISVRSGAIELTQKISVKFE